MLSYSWDQPHWTSRGVLLEGDGNEHDRDYRRSRVPAADHPDSPSGLPDDTAKCGPATACPRSPRVQGDRGASARGGGGASDRWAPEQDHLHGRPAREGGRPSVRVWDEGQGAHAG